mgnify:FL=1
MQKYSISLDWMQYYCEKSMNDVPATFSTTKGKYEVEKQSYSTNLWLDVYIIKHRGREFATLCCNPRNSGMPERGCTLKLANRVLYSHEWLSESKQIMVEMGLRYKGITRVDVAYDCNVLAGGRSVPSFLMQYFSHAPYCEGHIIRSGSRKVTINATRSNKGSVEISAMRWGSKGSDIGAYAYNKSLELREVKDKPWIRETWEKAGLIDAFNDEEWAKLSEKEKQRKIEQGDVQQLIECPVWRFEISIKAHGKDLLNIDTGELFKLDISYFEQQNAVENLFYTYAAKVFDFRMSTGQTTIRNYPPLKIFEMSRKVTERPVRVSLLADTGRTEKMIVNRLEALQSVYCDVSSADRAAMEATLCFIREISGTKIRMAKMRKENDYLSHMKGYKSMSTVIDEYLEFVDYSHRKRLNIDAQCSYSFWQGLLMECQLLDMSPQDSEITPVW